MSRRPRWRGRWWRGINPAPWLTPPRCCGIDPPLCEGEGGGTGVSNQVIRPGSRDRGCPAHYLSELPGEACGVAGLPFYRTDAPTHRRTDTQPTLPPPGDVDTRPSHIGGFVGEEPEDGLG